MYKMSQEQDTDSTNKWKPVKIEEKEEKKYLKKLKEWYNGRLQELINLSQDIEEEDFEEEEDWARIITNKQFGIL
jgi:hypothetical protein